MRTLKIRRLYDDESARAQESLVLPKSAEDHLANAQRKHVLGSNLDHAGARGMRQREEMAKVEVMGENHEPVIPYPGQDLPTLGLPIPDLGPVAGLDPVLLKGRTPRGG